jgi:septin family protein
VRITPFDPFAITVGKHELQVQLLDTPGYGDSLHAEESFDVICEYVEGLYAKQEEMEGGRAARDPEKLRHEDGLVHCCLYFIAPHRLKAIDVEFLRRLSPLVNIVPIIAKSDTMTTKEKEEFKLQVRAIETHGHSSRIPPHLPHSPHPFPCTGARDTRARGHPALRVRHRHPP